MGLTLWVLHEPQDDTFHTPNGEVCDYDYTLGNTPIETEIVETAKPVEEATLTADTDMTDANAAATQMDFPVEKKKR
eukprot:1195538-Prorocentrum_minimum.AAC.2